MLWGFAPPGHAARGGALWQWAGPAEEQN